jgi:excinuclease UvrABC nuclease subunit
MSIETARRYPFQYGVILANAPRDSGLYTLFKGDDLLYVGDAASICTRLLDHFDQRNFSEFGPPTTFAFEVCPMEVRKVLLMELVFKLRPPYTERPELRIRED